MFCAGHGGWVEDTSGDEADGMDETLVPVDFEESGEITDDTIFEEVGHPLVSFFTDVTQRRVPKLLIYSQGKRPGK